LKKMAKSRSIAAAGWFSVAFQGNRRDRAWNTRGACQYAWQLAFFVHHREPFSAKVPSAQERSPWTVQVAQTRDSRWRNCWTPSFFLQTGRCKQSAGDDWLRSALGIARVSLQVYPVSGYNAFRPNQASAYARP